MAFICVIKSTFLLWTKAYTSSLRVAGIKVKVVRLSETNWRLYFPASIWKDKRHIQKLLTLGACYATRLVCKKRAHRKIMMNKRWQVSSFNVVFQTGRIQFTVKIHTKLSDVYINELTSTKFDKFELGKCCLCRSTVSRTDKNLTVFCFKRRS